MFTTQSSYSSFAVYTSCSCREIGAATKKTWTSFPHTLAPCPPQALLIATSFGGGKFVHAALLVQWLLKDGIKPLLRMLFTAVYSRDFDAKIKVGRGWRDVSGRSQFFSLVLSLRLALLALPFRWFISTCIGRSITPKLASLQIQRI